MKPTYILRYGYKTKEGKRKSYIKRTKKKRKFVNIIRALKELSYKHKDLKLSFEIYFTAILKNSSLRYSNIKKCVDDFKLFSKEEDWAYNNSK